ncbi:MAG: methyltransferase domain-containing protein [Jejuia sp.]
MKDYNASNSTKNYWSKRYQEQNTGWDIGEPSSPLKTYIDQLETKDLKILIPGAGNSYEAEYLFSKGFKNVYVLDIAEEPLEALQKRVPDFPSKQILQDDFFEHQGTYDLILEQTFFCSFPPLPETRKAYAKQMHELLAKNGKLIGLWFDIPLTGDMEKRPFGGSKEEYLIYFEPYFKINTFEKCYNSIPPRMGSELFGVLTKV